MEKFEQYKNSEIGSYKTGDTILGTGDLCAAFEIQVENSLPQVLKVYQIPEEESELKSQWTERIKTLRELEDLKNQAKILDANWESDPPHLVRDHIPGKNMLELREQSGPSLDALTLTKGILTALASLHEKDQIHGNIKPSNIFISEKRNITITDAGLIRSLKTFGEDDSRLSPIFLSYCSPEQFDPSATLTPASDYFSLGCILFELITGTRAFEGMDVDETRDLILNGETPLLGKRNLFPPHIDQDMVNGLLFRLLDKDPSKRPESAEEVMNSLDKSHLFQVRPSQLKEGQKAVYYEPSPRKGEKMALAELITEFLQLRYYFQLIDCNLVEGGLTPMGKTLLTGVCNIVDKQGGGLIFFNLNETLAEDIKNLRGSTIADDEKTAWEQLERKAKQGKRSPLAPAAKPKICPLPSLLDPYTGGGTSALLQIMTESGIDENEVSGTYELMQELADQTDELNEAIKKKNLEKGDDADTYALMQELAADNEDEKPSSQDGDLDLDSITAEVITKPSSASAFTLDALTGSDSSSANDLDLDAITSDGDSLFGDKAPKLDPRTPHLYHVFYENLVKNSLAELKKKVEEAIPTLQQQALEEIKQNLKGELGSLAPAAKSSAPKVSEEESQLSDSIASKGLSDSAVHAAMETKDLMEELEELTASEDPQPKVKPEPELPPPLYPDGKMHLVDREWVKSLWTNSPAVEDDNTPSPVFDEKYAAIVTRTTQQFQREIRALFHALEGRKSVPLNDLEVSDYQFLVHHAMAKVLGGFTPEKYQTDLEPMDAEAPAAAPPARPMAAGAVTQAYSMDDQKAFLLVKAGKDFQAKGELAQAIEKWEEALEISPNEFEWLVREISEARAKLDKDKFEKASTGTQIPSPFADQDVPAIGAPPAAADSEDSKRESRKTEAIQLPQESPTRVRNTDTPVLSEAEAKKRLMKLMGKANDLEQQGKFEHAIQMLEQALPLAEEKRRSRLERKIESIRRMLEG